jgi:peptidoglycan/LPS O-acetylase OafA/YrhL
VSAVGIICALRKLKALRVLESRAMVRIGTISYGIYVYHVPVLLLMGQFSIAPGPKFMIYCATVIIISEISFRFLETPFLLLKDRSFRIQKSDEPLTSDSS